MTPRKKPAAKPAQGEPQAAPTAPAPVPAEVVEAPASDEFGRPFLPGVEH